MSSPYPRDDGRERCENHPLRDAELVVDLPSIGVRQFLCQACKSALESKLSGYTAFKGKREAWDHEGYDYERRGGDLYTRTGAGWRCEDPSDERTWK